MSLETKDDEVTWPQENTPQTIDAFEVERIQKLGEDAIISRMAEVKAGIERGLWDEDILKTQKPSLIWYIESQAKQVWDIISEGGSESYVQKLSEFQTFLENSRDTLLATLSPEEKAKMDDPKSSGTGAVNKNAYSANRMKAWRKNTRLF